MFTSLDPQTQDELRDAAREASTRAYCPYSEFRVGAAVLTVDGRIFTGCNVENASYGLTICAERVSLFAMVAAGASRPRVLVVYTPTETPTAPCGACRQVIREFGLEIVILSYCDGDQVISATADSLLPRAFGPDSLT